MKIAGLFFSYWKAMLIVFILGGFHDYALAQCDVGLEAIYHTSSTNIDKCGYHLPDVPPYYFLQLQNINTANGDEDFNDMDDPPYWLYQVLHANYQSTETITYDPSSCTIASDNVSGSESGTEDDSVYEGSPPVPPMKSYSDSFVENTDGSWTETSGGADPNIGEVLNGTYGLMYFPDDPTGSTTTTPTSSSSTELNSDIVDDDSESYSSTFTENYSSPYEDSLLISKVQKPPPFPSTWSTNLNAVFSSFGSASFNFGDDTHVSASSSKLEYKFHLTGGIKGTTYHVLWNEVTTYPNNQTTSINPKHDDITSNGDPVNGQDGQLNTINVPSSPSTIQVENIHISNAP